ncbi:ferritin family protein [Acetobacterium sp.]|jgi:rubrerythrin|uniref:ferritin-like domain-containing protein n=1 Tax=Acetobacterium sp. TaxID=1872094 RepID=UPI000CA80222|nr:ferritin family protein [Acetobacterium sp.]MDO9492131.1 ferritin family protein [Acetobacterium sp.]PKM70974.1 MAG: rubrerythrin [Firmicutes bacterium HGW-Firmicutes-17]
MNSIEFAIKMEHDGEKYYREQAESNQDNPLNVIFLFLADDEKGHAVLLENELKKITYELGDNETLSHTDNVFKDRGEFKNKFEKIPNQLDVYRMALQMEKDSIELYEKFFKETTDEQTKKLFGYLVKQEENHFKIFDNLINLVERPEEWVEDAEFGVREEY